MTSACRRSAVPQCSKLKNGYCSYCSDRGTQLTCVLAGQRCMPSETAVGMAAHPCKPPACSCPADCSRHGRLPCVQTKAVEMCSTYVAGVGATCTAHIVARDPASNNDEAFALNGKQPSGSLPAPGSCSKHWLQATAAAASGTCCASTCALSSLLLRPRSQALATHCTTLSGRCSANVPARLQHILRVLRRRQQSEDLHRGPRRRRAPTLPEHRQRASGCSDACSDLRGRRATSCLRFTIVPSFHLAGGGVGALRYATAVGGGALPPSRHVRLPQQTGRPHLETNHDSRPEDGKLVQHRRVPGMQLHAGRDGRIAALPAET